MQLDGTVVCDTSPYHGYAIEYSPYCAEMFACCANETFGIRGSGRIFVCRVSAGALHIIHTFRWPCAVNDIGWIQSDQRLLCGATADGSVVVFSTAHAEPLKVFTLHTQEVYHVHSCPDRTAAAAGWVVSASWDHSIRLFNIEQAVTGPTRVFLGHSDLVYSSRFAPHKRGCFASVSRDRTLKIWDVNDARETAVLSCDAHATEALCCDWDKYDSDVVITGGTEGLLKMWDLRRLHAPVYTLTGHRYAVKDVKCSPFRRGQFISASYDFTVRLWDVEQSPKRNIEVVDHHTEFVYGVDYNWAIQGQVADCAWDRTIKVYAPLSLRR